MCWSVLQHDICLGFRLQFRRPFQVSFFRRRAVLCAPDIGSYWVRGFQMACVCGDIMARRDHDLGSRYYNDSWSSWLRFVVFRWPGLGSKCWKKKRHIANLSHLNTTNLLSSWNLDDLGSRYLIDREKKPRGSLRPTWILFCQWSFLSIIFPINNLFYQ